MAENESAVTNAAKNLLALNPSQEVEFKKKVQEVKKRPKKRECLVSGVIYVGHLPRGIFEPQLKGYFEQFGTITRLRLSRSKKTGGSKGYAFIEFECDEVAKIVAETMNNYLMGERLIKCEVVAPEKVHARLFVGSQRMFRKPQQPAVRRYNKKHTPEEVERMTSRLLHKEAQLRKRLAAKGIDYNFPGFASQVQGKRRKTTAEADTSVCSQGDTPVCTPSVLEKRKSLKIDDDEEDDEIIIKATPAPKSKGKKKMLEKSSGAGSDQADAGSTAAPVTKGKTKRKKSIKGD